MWEGLLESEGNWTDMTATRSRSYMGNLAVKLIFVGKRDVDFNVDIYL